MGAYIKGVIRARGGGEVIHLAILGSPGVGGRRIWNVGGTGGPRSDHGCNIGGWGDGGGVGAICPPKNLAGKLCSASPSLFVFVLVGL